jgi:chromosomal replication initiation ATPase DnaA
MSKRSRAGDAARVEPALDDIDRLRAWCSDTLHAFESDLADVLDACRLVSMASGVPIEEVVTTSGQRGSKAASLARQSAMYLVRVALDRSQNRVAATFDRDHTSVQHACRVIEDLRDVDGFDQLLDDLEEMLQARARWRSQFDDALARGGPEEDLDVT